jgi:ubiquinone/menaquinone biosynthesis C-methylase UbiE
MPFSQNSQLTAILGWAESVKPTRVLDVGAGMGKYGFLLRNSLEAENLFVVDGNKGWQRAKKEWRVIIDGIEGFAGYVTPVHHWAYTNLFIAEALTKLATIQDAAYELVLAIDILEHFEVTRGQKFLNELKRVASHSAIVSTPKTFAPQDVPANPYENHRSLWTAAELASFGFSRILPNDESWIGVWERGSC